jgi:arylsulfatase A-like enzyme
VNGTQWMPLFRDFAIAQAPANLSDLSSQYARAAAAFIDAAAPGPTPFLLYMAFSHMHQICAPGSPPGVRTWGDPRFRELEAGTSGGGRVGAELAEVDWLTGEVLAALSRAGVVNNTLVVWTSDDGPWTGEQLNSGSVGPFSSRCALAEMLPLDMLCTFSTHRRVFLSPGNEVLGQSKIRHFW